MKHKERHENRSEESQNQSGEEPSTPQDDAAARASLKLAGGFGLVILLVVLLELLAHGTG